MKYKKKYRYQSEEKSTTLYFRNKKTAYYIAMLKKRKHVHFICSFDECLCLTHTSNFHLIEIFKGTTGNKLPPN